MNNRLLTVLVGATLFLVICNLALTVVWHRETTRELRIATIAAQGAESSVQSLSYEIEDVKDAVQDARDYLDARLEETAWH